MLTFATLIGIVIRLGVISMIFWGSLYFNSASLLMDGLFGVVDLISSGVLLLGIYSAAKPPDHDHPFGHGRFEPLAGTQIGLLMLLMGIGTFFWQFYGLFSLSLSHSMSQWLWLIPTLSVASFYLTGCYLSTVAQEKKSAALEAEATHFKWDAITSLIATAALLTGALFPDWFEVLDGIGAVFIAVSMVFVGIFVLKQNLHSLMDRVPDADYFKLVQESAKRVEGVFETEKIRIQHCGPDAHVDIDIEVDPALTVEKAHVISQQVRREIQKEWPNVRDVIVHIEPFYPGDH